MSQLIIHLVVALVSNLLDAVQALDKRARCDEDASPVLIRAFDGRAVCVASGNGI